MIRPIASSVLLVSTLALGGALVWANTSTEKSSSSTGELLYDRYCAACHGVAGDGKGPGAPLVWPQPRDFRSGNYKWRTTASGYPPTGQDLQRTIRYGVSGTSMHAFGDTLNTEQISDIIDVLKAFAPRKFRRKAEALALPLTRESDLAKGKRLFSTLGCVKCHGESARGDGPSADGLVDDRNHNARPYDLLSVPIRRPHAPGDDRVEQIYLSLLTGLSGSPMPAYAGAAPDEELWAVASYVDSLSPSEPAPMANNSAEIPPLAQDLDKREQTMRGGFYPGQGSKDERALFGGAIMPQGNPDNSLTPAQRSLNAKQCARCHNKQYREWQGSVHAAAGSPGLVAQLLAKERQNTTASLRSLQSCQRCHNPLAEQTPVLSAAQGNNPPEIAFQKNPNYSSKLRDQGLNCASCHVRNGKRYGPPLATDKRRLALPGYPLSELAIYERSDFCMPCHQLPSRSGSLAGKPLLNTYKEWLEGPYMRRGVQCQHCHMPDREHTWKGVHDPETFRQGIEVSTITGRGKTGNVSVRVRVKNVGAGHYLPTTPTPAAWVSITLVDRKGKAIEGAYSEQRIGRHIAYQGGWKEIEDTRIPPGENLELASAWKNGRVDEATHAKVEVRVEPDEYYERFYLRLLRKKSLPNVEREMLREALRRTRDSQYSAQSELVEIIKR